MEVQDQVAGQKDLMESESACGKRMEKYGEEEL